MGLIKEIYSDVKSGLCWLFNLSPKIKRQKYWMYGFIGLVLLVLFLISHSQKENGMTDWISALANVVMAGAAVTALIVARDWKQTLTESKAIEEVTNLKYIHIQQYSNALWKFLPSDTIAMMPVVPSLDFYDEENVKDLFISLSSMRSDLDDLREAMFKLTESIEKINFWGWDLERDKFEAYHKLDDLLNELYSKRHGFDKFFNDFLIQHNMYYNGVDDLPCVRYKRELASVDNTIKALNEFFNSSELYDKLTGHMNSLLNLRNSSLETIDVLSTHFGRVLDMITPRA